MGGHSNSSAPKSKKPGSEQPEIPQPVLAQAAAAATSQNRQDNPRPLTNEPTFDYLEDAPPPLYSQVYGQVDLHENGLSTVAQIADDGRVDIRIDDHSRVITNLLVPALRKQLESQQKAQTLKTTDQLTRPTDESSTYTGAESPPCLSIVIHVVGSRGDVQPFVALGKVLKTTYGHRVRLATHPNFRDFVIDNGLEFFSIGGDPSELMAFMVKNPGLMPGKDALRQGDIGRRRSGMYEIIHGCWRACFEAGDGTGVPVSDNQPFEGFDVHTKPFVADAIIANPPSFAHVHCAEKLGIPLHLMFTMPWSPTQAFPHPLANIQESSTDASITNFLSYALVELMTWQGLGDIVNRFREKTLGLEPLSLMWAPGMANRLRVPYTYCWSPTLIPKPKDWSSHISVSGFYFLSSADDYQPPPELTTFLESGPTPIYIGFGSIVVDDADAMTKLIFDAVEKSGQRALVSKGWGGFGSGALPVPESIHMLGNIPHDWLFRHVSCVVHHGGAGTTAAGITLGKPTVIVPFFGDQPFWGAMVAKAGAGPSPINNKELDAEKLAGAITFALKPSVLERAKELGLKVSVEKGSENGVQSFHKALDIDQMKCSISPRRAACWIHKRSNARLSAFSATVLGNAGLLDFGDLKLHRSKEYDIDETPWDPIGGAASALAGTIGSFMMGAADIPTEVFNLFSKKGTTATNTPKDDGKGSNKSSGAEAAVIRGSSKDHEDSDAVPDREGAKSKISIESALGAGKGIGRMVDVGLKSPMDFTLALAKGFHNAPKLYGDDTVRSVDKVTDLRSGLKAARKGFGYGFYDGISGMVTQPIEGAKKDGIAGFIKGFGKGIGGIVLKPGAAIWGIPGYTFKGIYKEIQKLYGSSVQNYIIAARTAQGFAEWSQASDDERLEVIEKWGAMQGDSALRPVISGGDTSGPQSSLANTQRQPLHASPHPETDEYENAIRESVQATSNGNAEEDAMVERAIRASLAELRARSPQNASQIDEELNRAVAASQRVELSPEGGTGHDNQALDLADGDDTDDDENIIEALRRSRVSMTSSDPDLDRAIAESKHVK